MTQDERIIALQATLENQGKVTIEQIMSTFAISRDSARRDLVKLAALPGVQRIRGGAIRHTVSGLRPSYLEKSTDSKTKSAIGKLAAGLVDADDHILLDASTSLTAMARHLTGPLRLVTNSPDILQCLSQQPDIAMQILGGGYDSHHRAVLGTEAVRQLTHYRVNKAFIGVCAVSESGLSTNSEAEMHIKRAMLQQADKAILVCDHSKFSTQNFFQVCPLQQIDAIVTDKAPAGALLWSLQQQDIEIICIEQTD